MRERTTVRGRAEKPAQNMVRVTVAQKDITIELPGLGGDHIGHVAASNGLYSLQLVLIFLHPGQYI